MKKWIAMTLCVAMVLSLFTGCGNGGKESSSAEEFDGVITIGVLDSSLVQDYETNKLTKWLEEQTGYDLKFYVFAATSADSQSQLATMVAGGEKLPDVIIGLQLSDSQIKDYGDDRYFLDIKDLLYDKEKSANYWALLEEAYPDEKERNFLLQRATDPDNGAMYAFPTMEFSMVDNIDSQVYINKVWLDKLGLDMPTDPESLHDVLSAFVNNDPNGNGKKDEIGIVGRPYGTFGHSATSWLLNMFCVMDTNLWFSVDDNGKLYLPFVTDEYRQGLIYLNQLTREGLLTKSIWNMTPSDTKRLLNPADGETNTVGIFVGHPSVVLQEGFENHYEYAPLPYWGYAMENEQTFSRSIYITEDCKNIDAVWKLLMTMNTKECTYRMRYGEYGVDWEYADPGSESFMGLPAEIKVLNENTWSAWDNQTWHNTVGCIMVHSENEVTQIPDDANEWAKFKYNLMRGTYDNFQAAKAAKPYTKMQRPLYTEEELLSIEAEMGNCKAWIEEMRARFATGTEGLDPANDKDWNAYLAELDKLGYKTWTALAQKVYNRQNGK